MVRHSAVGQDAVLMKAPGGGYPPPEACFVRLISQPIAEAANALRHIDNARLLDLLS